MTAAGKPEPIPPTAAALNAALVQLGALAERVGKLERRLAEPETEPYPIAPPRRWWQLSEKDREAELATLRHWAATVYVPGYGLLAGRLTPCWDRHDLVLYQLDWLVELFGWLYLRDSRPLAVLTATAEFQSRLLPQAAALIGDELGRCRTARGCRLDQDQSKAVA
jgi:hypothetical protein